MAETQKPGKETFKQDMLVEKLVKDPNHVPAMRILQGFLGKGSENGTLRIYSEPDMGEFLEFAETDVLHVHPLPAAEAPLGGSMVWLKAEAKLIHAVRSQQPAQAEGQPEPRKMLAGPADFLKGELLAAHLPGAGQMELPQDPIPTYLSYGRCPTCYRYTIVVGPTCVLLTRIPTWTRSFVCNTDWIDPRTLAERPFDTRFRG